MPDGMRGFDNASLHVDKINISNIIEAKYAHSKSDFTSKFQIALKEANETGYWLELLWKTGYIEENYFKELNELCTTIRIKLIKSINTVKNNPE